MRDIKAYLLKEIEDGRSELHLVLNQNNLRINEEVLRLSRRLDSLIYLYIRTVEKPSKKRKRISPLYFVLATGSLIGFLGRGIA